jgi:hypothetical protein
MLASSEFLNKHGLYAGRRSTKIHVAIYRRTRGRSVAIFLACHSQV